jgi:ATP/maltotriose-dependent transcriptional regulator MalT
MKRGDRGNARQHLEHAIALSRERGAQSWELRATLTLAEAVEGTGDAEAVRSRLADIYSRFTEGFESIDLMTAAARLGTPRP